MGLAHSTWWWPAELAARSAELPAPAASIPASCSPGAACRAARVRLSVSSAACSRPSPVSLVSRQKQAAGRQRLELCQSQSKTEAGQRLDLDVPWCAEARQRGGCGDSSARLGPVGGGGIAGGAECCWTATRQGKGRPSHLGLKLGNCRPVCPTDSHSLRLRRRHRRPFHTVVTSSWKWGELWR